MKITQMYTAGWSELEVADHVLTLLEKQGKMCNCTGEQGKVKPVFSDGKGHCCAAGFVLENPVAMEEAGCNDVRDILVLQHVFHNEPETLEFKALRHYQEVLHLLQSVHDVVRSVPYVVEQFVALGIDAERLENLGITLHEDCNFVANNKPGPVVVPH